MFPDEDQVDRTSGKRLGREFIKNVTGEDDVAVDIKNKDPWNGRLPIRFMYQSNQMPVLHRPKRSGVLPTAGDPDHDHVPRQGEDSGLEDALDARASGHP